MSSSSAKIREFKISFLSDRPTLRYVTIYPTPIRRGGWGFWCIIFSRDRIECDPVDADMVDRFLVYNANVTLEQIKEELMKFYGAQSEAEVASQVNLIWSMHTAVLQLRRYIEGEEIHINYIPVAALEEGIDFAKQILTRGIDGQGKGMRARYKPLGTSSYVLKLGFLKIPSIFTYYQMLYRKKGKPFFFMFTRENRRDLFSRLSRFSDAEVDKILDIVIKLAGTYNTYAVTTHVAFLGMDGRSCMVDAKRLLVIPSPDQIQAVIGVVSGTSAVIGFVYETVDVNLVRKRILSRTLFEEYLKYADSKLPSNLSDLIEAKINKVIYGYSEERDEEEEEESLLLTAMRKTRGEATSHPREEKTLTTAGSELGKLEETAPPREGEEAEDDISRLISGEGGEELRA